MLSKQNKTTNYYIPMSLVDAYTITSIIDIFSGLDDSSYDYEVGTFPYSTKELLAYLYDKIDG
jgi:hypothetical protein